MWKRVLLIFALTTSLVWAQGGRMDPGQEAWWRQIYLTKTNVYDQAVINAASWTNFYKVNSNILHNILIQGITNVVTTFGNSDNAVYTGHTAYISFNTNGVDTATAIWSSNQVIQIWDELNYATPTVAWVASIGGTYVKGRTLTNVNLSFTVNKAMTNRFYSNGYTATLGAGSDNTLTNYVTNSANVAYTATVWDSRTNSSSTSQTITFSNLKYYGVSATETNLLTNADILALSYTWQSKGNSGTAAPSDQYIYVIYPASYGACSSFTLGGFATSAWPSDTRDVTNSYGYSESYLVYRSNNKLTSASIAYDIH